MHVTRVVQGLTGNTKYRVNIFGKHILQVEEYGYDEDMYGSGPTCKIFRDAKSVDLRELDILQKAKESKEDKNIIKLNPEEIQSGYTRLKWAEGLIRQLPKDHDGRNSWLYNYGSRDKDINIQ